MRSQQLVGLSPRTHNDYLDFLDRVLDLFIEKGGRSVKLMTAYFRTLRFAPIPDLEARRLFARGPANLRGEGLARLGVQLEQTLLELVRLELEALLRGRDIGDAALDVREQLALLLVRVVQRLARVLRPVQEFAQLRLDHQGHALDQTGHGILLLGFGVA